MLVLLLSAAVPFSGEEGYTARQRQNVQDILETTILVSVVEELDMFQQEPQTADAGETDLSRRAGAEGGQERGPEQERADIASSVRQIGRDLRRIADELAVPNLMAPKRNTDCDSISMAPFLRACVTGAAVATGAVALLHRFLGR